MSEGVRRLDIQGLRAVAVLAVVIYHAGLPLPGGFAGVDVFFVISGFVIVAMLLRQWQTQGRTSLRVFYGRRFWRLAPALALMVGVVVTIGMAVLSPFGAQQTLAWTALGAMFLSANVAIAATSGGYFDQAAVTNPLLNTWSLSVEEQFYLAFPLLLISVLAISRAVDKKPRGSRQVGLNAVLILILGLTASSFLLAVAANDLGLIEGSEILTGFYSPFSRAWEFGLGAIVAVMSARGLSLPRRLGAPMGGAGALLIVAAFLTLEERSNYPGVWTLLPTVGAALVILAGTNQQHPVSWLLSRKPMVTVGDYSYSIYLWHWPVIVFAVLIFPGHPWIPVVAAALSFLPAAAFYRWVEEPLRHRAWSGHRAAFVWAAVVVLAPVLLIGTLFAGSALRWGDRGAQTLVAKAAVEHVGFLNCMSFTPLGAWPAMQPDACLFNASAAQPPLYLVGDSNAAHLSEAVIGAGQLLNNPVRISTAAGCPFLDVYRYSARYPDQANQACRHYYVDTLAFLEQERPGVVVLGMSVGYWTDPSMVLGLDAMPTSGSSGPTPSVATEGLRRTIRALTSLGHRVIVVKPALTFPGQSVSYDQCSALGLVLDRCPFEVHPDEVQPEQRQARDDIEAVARGEGAVVVDVIARQCADGLCRATSRGIPVYSDSTHFSPEFSTSIAGLFAEAMLKLGTAPTTSGAPSN